MLPFGTPYTYKTNPVAIWAIGGHQGGGMSPVTAQYGHWVGFVCMGAPPPYAHIGRKRANSGRIRPFNFKQLVLSHPGELGALLEVCCRPRCTSIVRSASNPIRDGPYMKSPINLWNCPRVVCEHFPNFLGPNTHRNGFFYGR